MSCESSLKTVSAVAEPIHILLLAVPPSIIDINIAPSSVPSEASSTKLKILAAVKSCELSFLASNLIRPA